MDKKAAEKKNRIWILCLIAAALLLAVAVELCYTAVKNKRIDSGNYEKTDVSAAQFEAVEFDSLGGSQYYALANDSYFSVEGLGGISAQAIKVWLEPQMGDNTQRLLFFSGKKDGVEGEFMVALAEGSAGVFVAEANFESIDSIMIFPTEQVRSTLAFSGITINPYVVRESFSLARSALWALLALAAACAVGFVADRRKKLPAKNIWVRAAIIAAALGGLLGFVGSGVFMIGRSAGKLLISAGALGAAIAVGFVWLLAKKIKTAPNRVFTVILVCGAIFCFASAPLQAPDEQNHFLRAYALSQGTLNFDYSHEYPGDVNWLIDSFPAEYNNKLKEGRVPSVPQRLLEYFEKAETPHVGVIEYRSTIQVNLPYVPAALGILLTRLLGLNALFGLWAARLMNVVVYAFCARWAIKKAARYEIPLMAMLLLPIALFMVASVSYDAIFLAALAVFIGSVLAGRQTRTVAIFMFVSFALMIYIKPVYIPLCALVFLIPKQSVEIKPKNRAAQLAALALAGLLAWGASLLYAGAVDSGIPPSEGLRWVNAAPQIKYVLLNPLRYLVVALVDGLDNAFYLGEGGLFGALDANAKLTGILVPVSVAFVSLLAAASRKEKPRKRETGALFAFAVFLYLLIVTSFYAAWSTLGSSSILGVQARYFIPVVFLISAAISGLFGRKQNPGFSREAATSVSFSICSSLAFLAVAELFMAYFI